MSKNNIVEAACLISTILTYVFLHMPKDILIFFKNVEVIRSKEEIFKTFSEIFKIKNN